MIRRRPRTGLLLVLIALIAWTGLSTPASAAVIFIEAGTAETQGFEFYTSSLTNSTLTSVTTPTHTGTRSINCHGAITGSSRKCQVRKRTIAVSSGRASMWFYTTDATQDTDATITWAASNIGTPLLVLEIQLTAAGVLELTTNGTTVKTGATAIAVNTWTRISWGWTVTSTTNWGAKVYINGTQELAATNADATLANSMSGNVDYAFGMQSVGAEAAVVESYFSDLYIDDVSSQADTGDIRVTAKRPNANGTTNGFTTQIGAGGSGYGSGHSPQVNEKPLSVTNGWSEVVVGSATTEEYNIENASTGDVDLTGQTIVASMGWIYASALASETGQIVVDGATSNVSLTSANTLFVKMSGASTYPAGTGTDIGLVTSTTVTTVSLFECGTVIAYTAAAGPALRSLTLLGVGR